MRKAQKFDWDRKYHKRCWEGAKKAQKFLRLNPEFNSLELGFSCGKLRINEDELSGLHKLRGMLKVNHQWKDEITEKITLNDELRVIYQGKGAFDFINLIIDFNYETLSKEVLGDCYIETKETVVEEYLSTSRNIVCPVSEG